jgi:hypothetical protein
MPLQQLVDENVVVVGWGERNSGSSTKMLQIINLRILSKRDCEIRISRSNEQILQLDENLVCTAKDPLALLMQVIFSLLIIQLLLIFLEF